MASKYDRFTLVTDFELRGEEAVDGVPCWRIESRPRRKKSSQYTQSVIWVRQTDYVPARLDAYIKDQVVRRLSKIAIAARPQQPATEPEPAAPAQPKSSNAKAVAAAAQAFSERRRVGGIAA